MKWFRRHDPRVRDELRYHRERLIDDHMAAGLRSAPDADVSYGSA